LHLPRTVSGFVTNSILNFISPDFRIGYVCAAQKLPVSTKTYWFGLSFEKEATKVCLFALDKRHIRKENMACFVTQ
jgi:hypothetical protein